ncbi:ceramidase [Coprinopsis marcescibilis]|uniref:Neutral ceramidase n=1 Tax=Coprinopsis marcescibilis TaxID=230819 RepID=A0A5C3KHN5_COPMA|nr:ceramidase [Coprinopsis marcescibilis]
MGSLETVSLRLQSALSLTQDFVDLTQSFLYAMWNGLLLLTALAASTSVLPGQNGIPMVAGQYLLGLGVGDVTGPIVETNLMGYASLEQNGRGLHMRQRSRAYIVADGSAPNNRIVFINAGLYNDQNIAFVGTHSHAGVGGYLENLLPQITSLGYVKQTADAIVDGTVLAVQRAHASIAPGRLSVGSTNIVDGNINRSPIAYLANPAEERARYQYDTDKELTLLRFDDDNGNARGFLSFFPVHGTSLYINNTLVSTDNKGMAAFLYENSVEPDSMPGNATFVAGFAQANVGDTTPNTLGAFCHSPGKAWHGQPCDPLRATCGDTVTDCQGRGPGFQISDFESNRIIGELQFRGAQRIMESQGRVPVHGAVRSAHAYMAMDKHRFTLPNGTTVSTCSAALGFSFAGGTTDGPGAFDFTQGTNSSQPRNVFWDIVKGAVTPTPSAEQIRCHHPKPILLNSGAAHVPYDWTANTVSVQILRAGNFVMLIMPGELSTMAGRRIREALRNTLISSGILGSDANVVVAGPANTYAHYVTTREEYQIQRYEGASTVFGPFTLEAYIDKYSSMVPFLADNASGTPPSDAAPPEQTSKAISLQTGVVFDAAPIGKKFGDVLQNVNSTPYRAGDKVAAQFVGANPRNNLRLEGTFLTVDRLVAGQWRTVRSDSHPSTIFEWVRTNTVLGFSTVTISWTIETGTPAGTYRLSYFGNSKPLIGSISSFSGVSGSFTIV